MPVDIVGIGYPVMDCLLSIPRIPAPNSGVGLLEQSWQGGGMIATGLATASTLGASAGIYGIAGDDQYGHFCRRDLASNGVDTSHLLTDSNKSTFISFVLCAKETKSRSFIGKQGSHRRLSADELDDEYILGAKYLFVTAMDEASVAACKLAKANKIKTFIDANAYDDRTMSHLGLIDYLVGSEDFYMGALNQKPYNEGCRILSGAGPETVVITLGESGCVYLSGGVYKEAPSYNVEVIDTCGAGDVYHGAFLYALTKNWDIDRTVSFSSAVAAISCTRLGGRAGIPTAAVAERFMETGEIDYSQIDKRVEMYRKGVMAQPD